MFVASPGVQLAVTGVAQRVRLTRTQSLHSQLLQVFDHHGDTGRGQCTGPRLGSDTVSEEMRKALGTSYT